MQKQNPNLPLTEKELLHSYLLEKTLRTGFIDVIFKK